MQGWATHALSQLKPAQITFQVKDDMNVVNDRNADLIRTFYN